MAEVLNVLYQPTSSRHYLLTTSNSIQFEQLTTNHHHHHKYNKSNANHFSAAASTVSLQLFRRRNSGRRRWSSKSRGLSFCHACSLMQDNSTCQVSCVNNGRRQGPLRSVFPASPAQVSSVEDLFEFICSGPLMEKMGLASESVANFIDKWLEYGIRVCKLFQLNELFLTTPQKARIYHYYIPVFMWCEQKISHHMSTFKDGEEAEIAMRADGKPGMSDEEVEDYVSRLPAYKAYLPSLYSDGPSGSDPEHTLIIDIDEGRNPILAT